MILVFQVNLIDSLRKEISGINGELQTVKKDLAEGTDLDKLISLLTDQDIETAPDDQRSKRKRVDALLKAITQQPGILRFNGGSTNILQSFKSKNNQIVAGTASFDIYAFTSFGRNTLLFFDFEAIGGNGPNSHFDSFHTLNADAGSTQDQTGVDRLTVLEGWAEFTALDEMFTVTAGKIDLTNYFDNNASANDETSQFLNSSFVNSAAFVAPGNSPGIRVRTTLLKRFYLQFGAASLDNSGDKLTSQLFKIGSVGFKVFPESSWEANLRIYLFEHPLAKKNYSAGLSFDQSVARMFNIFARYGQNEPVLANESGIKSAWSLGMRFVRTIAGRRLAIGVAHGKTQSFMSQLLPEKTTEIYVRQQLNKWTFVSPHLLFVNNLYGTSKNTYLFGLRTQFNF